VEEDKLNHCSARKLDQVHIEKWKQKARYIAAGGGQKVDEEAQLRRKTRRNIVVDNTRTVRRTVEKKLAIERDQVLENARDDGDRYLGASRGKRQRRAQKAELLLEGE
jgi:hypothetical protein